MQKLGSEIEPIWCQQIQSFASHSQQQQQQQQQLLLSCCCCCCCCSSCSACRQWAGSGHTLGCRTWAGPVHRARRAAHSVLRSRRRRQRSPLRSGRRQRRPPASWRTPTSSLRVCARLIWGATDDPATSLDSSSGPVLP